MNRSQHEWPKDRIARCSRHALRMASFFVPAGGRREWLNEWDAELWQLLRQREGLVRLGLFLVGALGHGLWEWKEGWSLDSFAQDARFAVRTLVRSPGFTVAAVFMLALSIGANTALFSVLEEAVLAEPPFPEPERLVVIDNLLGPSEDQLAPSQWSYPPYQALREEVESIESAAGYSLRTMTLTELGDPEIISVEVVSPSLFALLGVDAVRGRVFGPDEIDDGSAIMVGLISNSFWQTRLGSATDAIGGTVTLDGLRVRVLGVLPAGFEGITGGAQVWLPFSALREIGDDSLLEDPWNKHFDVLGRLAPDATIEMARAEVRAFGSTLMERYPAPVGASRLVASGDVSLYREVRVNPVAQASMYALFGAVILVLLIATANLVGLLLARGATRQRETAIRAALGAGRGRLVRQLLTESLALACIGGVLGVLVAWVGIDFLGAWLAEAIGTGGGRGLQYFDPDALSINWRVLGFATLLTGGVGIAFGILPAWQAARADPNAVLKDGRASVGCLSGRRGSLGRNSLIVVQVGVAIVLLTGATIMMRSLANMQRVDLGYDPDGLFTAIYSLTPVDEQSGIDPGTFHVEFLERVRQLPGVTAATLGEVPMGGPTWRSIVLGSEGRPDLTPALHTWVRLQPVADGNLEVLGARLLEGRDIQDTDTYDAERVVVLNERAVAELFPLGNPIGQRVQLAWSGFGGAGATVIGVVADLQLDEPGRQPELQAFVPVRQGPQLASGIMVRSRLEPGDLVPALRSALAQLSPNVVLTSTMTMQERAATITARPRVVALLLTVFGAVSLFLVAAGLYGTIAFTVAGRTRELGLRASLGADKLSLMTLVLRQGLGVTLIGIACGLIAATWATRFLQGLVFGAETLDPVVLAGVSVVLFLVACAAAILPARRAMRIDPMVALRTD